MDKNSIHEVTFNIKLVEADTGKPLPNTTYYLEYKNNIKPHTTNSSGIDSNVRADVNQPIGVLLNDDEGKKQSISSMDFDVTADLNGQTKILKVPVVSFSIRFVDDKNKVIPNYSFKTIYRNRESEIRKANSQGVTQLKALAGQKITIIDANTGAKTSGVVTDGALKWTIRINSSALEETKISSKTPDVVKDEDSLADEKSSTNNDTPELQVKKPKIKEKEVITSQGPTHKVESDETLFTIKFLDESTNKPISGLTYYTKSTNYGKKPSVTGSDGTRGRPHESLIGVEITVLVYEDGKDVEKGRFTVSHDRDEPYVYKAKKPKNYLFPLPIKPTADYKSGMRSFGSNRSKGKRKHAGADLYAPTGTKVRAMESGVVLNTGPFYAGTNQVTIQHESHIIRYGELDPKSIMVKKDQKVGRGDPIGKVGRLIGINVPSNMLHLEMFSNVNDTSTLTIKGASGGIYQRRSDLINPNVFLDKADR